MPDDDPNDLATIADVIRLARRRLDPAVHTWAASGAGSGHTVDRNARALASLALVPRVMRDVSNVDMATSVAGIPMAMPVFLAPVGALSLYDPADALASCEAAGTAGTSVMCSSLTKVPWADVAATAPGRHMFQLYVFGDREWTANVLAMVEEAGFGSLSVTVDTPEIGRRDLSLEARAVFVWGSGPDGPPNMLELGWDASHRTRYTIEDLAWLCGQATIPVIAKGIMTPADAVAAVDAGVAVVYVSNHGGRQVDHAVSTIEVLAEIVDAVADRAQVVVDSGFYGGADVCKALALGARAVGIGRLQCWGLAAGGPAGLSRTLEILREEVRVTMANTGCRTIDDLTPDHVRWSLSSNPGGG